MCNFSIERSKLAIVSAWFAGFVLLFAAHTQIAAYAQSVPIEVVPRLGHSAAVASVAVSPDGRTIVSGSYDDSLKLWDMASGRELRTFTGHSAWVFSVAFSPDGRTIVSASEDKTLKLWDSATGRELRTLTGHRHQVHAAVFSPDGRVIVSGSWDKTLKLWDAASGRELRTIVGHAGAVNAVAFSPDGRRIVSAGEDKTLKLWDVASGQGLRTLTGHGASVYAVAFSPDGRQIVSASQDKTLKIWDAASGRVLHTLKGHVDIVTSAAFSPNGHTVISGSWDTTLKLWDVASGQERRTFEGHIDWVFAATFSRDGRTIVSGAGGPTSRDNTVRLWEAGSGEGLRTLTGNGSAATAVAFSPDGRTAVSGNTKKELKLWDAADGRELQVFTGHTELIWAIAFSPDGRTIVSGSKDKTLKLWDAASGHELHTFAGHSSSVKAVAFSPDGRFIVSGGGELIEPGDKAVKLWDAANGRELRTLLGHANAVNAVAFSPDGRTIVSGSSDRTLKLWDAASGRLLRTLNGHTDWVHAVAFSPDGRTIVSASSDKTLKLWDAATGRLLRTLTGHGERVIAVAFSSDGSTIVSAGYDRSLKLWDTASGRDLRTLIGHSSVVHAVAFSPDGSRILSASGDSTLKIWLAQTEELLVTLVSGIADEHLAIAKDGFFSASDGGADAVSVVRGRDVYSVAQFYRSLYRPDLVRLKLSDDPVARKLVNKAASLRNLDLVLNSGAPPEVSIVSPKPESRSADMNVVVEAKISVKSAADKGGGIGRVEWRVNGITKEVQNVDRPAESTTGGLNLKHFFALGEGENLIEIIAYNHENLVASPPSRVLVAVESSTPRPRPNLHVLAVGIDKYRYDVLNLKYAAADAKAISAAFGLPNAGKDIYEQIFVHDPLLDEQVTAENLKKKLEEIGKEMRPDDVFVLYMAGHAVTDAVLGRHFIPHDGNYENQDREKLIATSIGQDQLQEWLALIPALRSVLIFDACESEQTTSDFTPFRGSQQPVAVANLSKASGRTMLAATTGFGAALEGYNGHGIFTYVLLEALAQADADKNGKIETKELENYLVSRLPELTEELSKQSPNTAFKRQVPQINVVGAGFTLVNRADILNQPAAVVQP